MGSAKKNYEIESLKNLTKELYLQNDVIFTGSLDRNTLKSYLQYCDVSLSAIPPSNIYQLSSPTKLYESLGNCIPVVANKGILEHEKVINQSRGGILVDYNIEDFSKGILKLLQNDVLRKKMGKNGKEYVLKKYNYRFIARNIEKYFY
jgi:glycosyltransferase involved in cell wall biosynthesis